MITKSEARRLKRGDTIESMTELTLTNSAVKAKVLALATYDANDEDYFKLEIMVHKKGRPRIFITNRTAHKWKVNQTF